MHKLVHQKTARRHSHCFGRFISLPFCHVVKISMFSLLITLRWRHEYRLYDAVSCREQIIQLFEVSLIFMEKKIRLLHRNIISLTLTFLNWYYLKKNLNSCTILGKGVQLWSFKPYTKEELQPLSTGERSTGWHERQGLVVPGREKLKCTIGGKGLELQVGWKGGNQTYPVPSQSACGQKKVKSGYQSWSNRVFKAIAKLFRA
jgi:hypothetical protein